MQAIALLLMSSHGSNTVVSQLDCPPPKPGTPAFRTWPLTSTLKSSHTLFLAFKGQARVGLSLPTSPGLALPDKEGPSRVSRQQQQFLSFLPAQALIQPPEGKKHRGTGLAWEWMG